MLELYNIVYVVSGLPASPIVNCQKQLAVETESQIESCHAHPSVGSSRSRPCDVVDGRDDRQRRQPRSRLRPPSGRSEPCASRPPSSRSGCASAWIRSFRRCCANTASTCGSCRCASTTRTRCSRRSRRQRPSQRGGARSTSSSTSARRPARLPPLPASSGLRSAAPHKGVCSRRGDRPRRRPATSDAVSRRSSGAMSNGRRSAPSSRSATPR